MWDLLVPRGWDVLQVGQSDGRYRCSVCNALIETIPKEEARGHVPPGVYHRHREFWRCRQCGRGCRQASHFALEEHNSPDDVTNR